MSKSFNDYDYCLPHLLDKYEEYKKYFQWAKENNRYIIMDNSLHELGHAYDTDRLIHWINELQPDEFIVPDVWEDMEASIKNAAEWIRIALPPNILKVAVVQAKSIREAAECYFKYKTLGYKKIAFSYGAGYYKEHFNHPNPAISTAMGRVNVIGTLHAAEVIDDSDRIHLLGCAVPQEFIHYKDMKFIETIDTSNPIMAAMEGILYTNQGLDEKPITKIDDVMNKSVEMIDWVKIHTNVNKFREINQLDIQIK
jgi:hypothetical protein